MAPCATPTAKPSGILCRVIEVNSNKHLLRDNTSFLFLLTFSITLLQTIINNPPHKNPKNTTIKTLCLISSAKLIAGLSSEKKAAESMIPAEKESKASIVSLLTFLKKKTIEAPKTVKIKVKTPPNKAYKTI